MNPARKFAHALQSALLAACLGLPAATAAQEPGAAGVEAFLRLRYAGVVDVVVTARYDEGTFYYPLTAVLRALDVDARLEAATGAVQGFFPDPQHRYAFDAARAVLTADGRDDRLDPADVRRTPDELYVRAALLRRVFGIELSENLREMEVLVSAATPLPVARAALREARRLRPSAFRGPLADAPVGFGRTRALLDGGVAQYTLATDGSTLSYDLGAGAEVLGGDLEALAYGALARGGAPSGRFDGRWRYVFDASNRVIQQVSAGVLTSSGLRGRRYAGVQVTNGPPNPRTVLGQQLIAGETQPNWEVELYVNGQLAGYTRADPRGHFQFPSTATYGSSLVSLRYYGPGGEVLRDERQVWIPQALVPRGTLEYHASAGRTEAERQGLAQGSVAYGLTSWLTNAVGVDHLAGDSARPLLYDALALRLPRNYVAGLEASPGNFYRGTLDGLFPSLANFSVSYFRALRDGPANPLSLRQQLQGRLFLPLDVGAVPVSLHVLADAERRLDGTRSSSFDGDLLLTLARLKPSVGYRRAREGGAGARDAASVGFYYVFPGNGAPRLVRDALLMGSAEYDLRDRLVAVSAQIDRRISANARIGIGVSRAALPRRTSIDLRYSLDLPTTRWASTVRADAKRTSASQLVRGAIGYDPADARAHFSGREWLGNSAARFRFFLDSNGDGRFQAGEPALTGGGVHFRESVAVTGTGGPVVRADDLLPYHRYNVTVDALQMANPLWTPALPEFSFITDPNSYKRIDVPFYAGGVLEGTVTTKGGAGPLGGVTLELRRADGSTARAVTTFADGSFYLMAIPPGDYTLAPDPDELRQRGLGCDGCERAVHVPNDPDGAVLPPVHLQMDSPAR